MTYCLLIILSYPSPFYKHSGKFVMKSADPIPNAAQRAELKAYGWWLTFKAKGVERKDLLTSDPFLVIKAMKTKSAGPNMPPVVDPSAQPVVVAKTEVIKSNLNPVWQPTYLDVALCGGYFAPIFIEIFDWDANHKHVLSSRLDYINSDASRRITSVKPKPRSTSFAWEPPVFQ